MTATRFTKGDCFAITEFLDELVENNLDVVHNIADSLGYDRKRMIEVLAKLSGAVDGIITVDKNFIPDNEQMADIMRIKHIPEQEQ
jgi:hypothetical protein